jgi:hypothetical protein
MKRSLDFTQLFLCLLFLPMGLSAIADNFYYVGAGTTVSNCQTRACDTTKCGIGFYLTGCGGASNPTNPGVCTSACTNKPSFSSYTSNGGLSASGCSWACNAPDYTLYQGACVPSVCTVALSAGSYTMLDNTAGVCTYTCEKGYFGPTPTAGAKGPASCTACEETKYTSAIGQTSCLTCGAGTFQVGTAKTVCQNCVTPFYNDVTTGVTVCKNCPTTCSIGSFTNGCGGSSPGSCVSCNN